MTRRWVSFALFVGLALAVALVVVLAGEPFMNGDGAAIRAWRWGCGVSLAASILAGLVVLMGSGSARRSVAVGLGATLVRLLALAAMAVVVAAVLALEPKPFLLALAVSYVVLLVVDTGYALVALRRL